MSDELLARLDGEETVEALTAWAFGPGGPLARAGFEVRESQSRMAAIVARRIDGGGWAAVEAPTGCGKSLSYLIPGVLQALRVERRGAPDESEIVEDKAGVRRYKDGRYAPRAGKPLPIVVSTANIALQSQLLGKDVPAVARILGVEVRAALLKGRANYACLEKLAEAEMFSAAGDVARRVRDLTLDPAWDGDREGLDFDPGREWADVSADSTECAREACPHYSEGGPGGGPACYAERARGKLADAHVVVMNHHYLALARPVPSCLLAVDEAHDLEEALRGVSSRRVSAYSARKPAGYIKRALGLDLDRLLEQALGRLTAELDRALGDRDAQVLRPGWTGLTEYDLGGILAAADLAAEKLAGAVGLGQVTEARVRKAIEALHALHRDARMMVDGAPTEAHGDGAWAIFAAREGRRGDLVVGNAVPASVADATVRLARANPGVVLCSATLAPGGSFRALERALELDGAARPVEQVALPSPFPLHEQGVLVVPPGPGPKDQGWEEWAAAQVVAAVRAAGGRTLVLSSTHRMARAYAAALRAETTYPVRLQGEAGRTELRNWFRECVEGVLVASRSFFQGLDVQGEACSCVVIDRVPFAPPGDPVEDAVGAHLARSGGSAFQLRALPRACTAMAQGAGRLIRAATDRGAVVVLDNRVAYGPMARQLRAALPPFPDSTDVEDVRRVLAGEPIAAPLVRKAVAGALPRRRKGAA